MTGITVWTLRWCDLHTHHLSVTLIWTFLALAFFAAGLTLKDRHYRLGGLCLLGLAIGRVFFIDVWTLEPVLRILSFIALGTALHLVGYFYNRSRTSCAGGSKGRAISACQKAPCTHSARPFPRPDTVSPGVKSI